MWFLIHTYQLSINIIFTAFNFVSKHNLQGSKNSQCLLKYVRFSKRDNSPCQYVQLFRLEKIFCSCPCQTQTSDTSVLTGILLTSPYSDSQPINNFHQRFSI